MTTKTINLRDVPEDLVRRAKAHAALQGLTLKDFILRAVQQVMDATGPELATRALFITSPEPQQKHRTRRAKRKRPRQ